MKSKAMNWLSVRLVVCALGAGALAQTALGCGGSDLLDSNGLDEAGNPIDSGVPDGVADMDGTMDDGSGMDGTMGDGSGMDGTMGDGSGMDGTLSDTGSDGSGSDGSGSDGAGSDGASDGGCGELVGMTCATNTDCCTDNCDLTLHVCAAPPPGT